MSNAGAKVLDFCKYIEKLKVGFLLENFANKISLDRKSISYEFSFSIFRGLDGL